MKQPVTLGKELGVISTLVMLENISARIAENAKKWKITGWEIYIADLAANSYGNPRNTML
ncbi:MAG: hypothetical protein HFH15_16100 [Ruminococcus sp.]|jgi:hypothetical protein|nr:hypothetical protein [Ruminococcus sp.]